MPRRHLAVGGIVNGLEVLEDETDPAMNAIPRGGATDITVTGVARMGDAPPAAFVLKAKGPNARIPPHAETLLAGLPESGVVGAHGVQTYYVGLVERAAA